MIAEKIPAIQELSVEDKVSLAAELWEELERLGTDLPVSEEQRRILDERYGRHGDATNPGRSWDEIKGDLLKRIGG